MVVKGAKNIGVLAPTLSQLRECVGQSSDVVTSLDWFLSRTSLWDSIPVLVLHSVDHVPKWAVMLHLRCWHGLRTGVLGCGDLTGDGGVIASMVDQAFALEQAIRTVLAKGLAHTAIATIKLSKLAEKEKGRVLATESENTWRPRIVHCQLDLTKGLNGFLAAQSRKFRRNFRYYRRRAEAELGCRFVPCLTVEQSIAAVQSLHAYGLYSVPAQRAVRHEAALRKLSGSFAAGLLDAKGRWLSYVAGWREGDASLIEWQLNHGEQEGASLSTVMRSFFVEHEAEHGAKSIVFVGGTSSNWARACQPETCLDMLATRNGLVGGILSTLVARLHPGGQLGNLHRSRSRQTAAGLRSADDHRALGE